MATPPSDGSEEAGAAGAGRPAGPTAGPPARRRSWWVALTALLVALAAWLIYQRWGREFDWRAFGRSFASLDWRWLGLSSAIAMTTYLGRALRWAVMLRPLRPRPNLWHLFTATVIGFASVVLVGRPAELVRPYLIATREGVPFSSQLGAWVLERIADMLAILLVFGFALTQVGAARRGMSAWLRWVLTGGGYVAAAGVLVLVVLLILMGRSPGHVHQRLKEALEFLPPRQLARVERMLAAFLDGLSILRDRKAIAWFAAYTALEWVLIALCVLTLLRAYPGMPLLGPSQVIVFMGLISFGSLFQIPGIGGGVQVAAVVVLGEVYRVPIELASSIALMLWVVTFVVVVPFGIPLALHEGLNWKKMKQMRLESEL